MDFLLEGVVTTADVPLQDFATTFFGYGTWSAPFWFVGMEEGGDASACHLTKRVDAWLAEGRPEIVDLARYLRRLGGTDCFAESAPLQSTWRLLMRAVCVANGVEPTVEVLREYQRTRLGREDGETALLELLPFPSPRIRDWPYEDLGWDRKTYRRELEPLRRARLTQLIERHRPRVVVFYGQPRYWRSLFPGDVGPTRIRVMPHPTAHGTKNETWDALGRWMQELAGSD